MEQKVKRRNFIQLVSATTLASAAAPLMSFAAVPKTYAADDFRFLTPPYLQNPGLDAMTILWLTSKPAYSWIELTPADGTSKKIFSVTDGLIDLDKRNHRVRLKNLKPATKYSYKVYSKEVLNVSIVAVKAIFGATLESDPYEFTTGSINPKEFNMLVLNDIHEHPESFAHLLNLNGDKPYDLVFLNGDMFNHVRDENQLINQLIAPCSATFAAGKPFLYLRGNHETRGILSRSLPDYFENIDHKNYFTFTRGPVHFICLDSGEDKVDDHVEYGGLVDFDLYREQQAIWLEEQLKSEAFKKAKFSVVMMHIPHYHSGDWHGTLHCRKLFGPLFNKYKIDMLMSGHTHVHGIHKPQEGHNFPIVIGGGPEKGIRTLIRLEVNHKALNVVMTKDTGEVVGTYVIKK